jgi:hypothetical protein
VVSYEVLREEVGQLALRATPSNAASLGPYVSHGCWEKSMVQGSKVALSSDPTAHLQGRDEGAVDNHLHSWSTSCETAQGLKSCSIRLAQPMVLLDLLAGACHFPGCAHWSNAPNEQQLPRLFHTFL